MKTPSNPLRGLALTPTHWAAAFSVWAIMTTLCSISDQALSMVRAVPYSPVWVLINPMYDTQMPYRFWLALVEAISFSGMIYAVKHWGLPYRVAYAQALGIMVFAMTHWHQNITVTVFAWTAWYAWPMMFIALQKLPLGWSWDLSDAHYKCLTECYAYTTNVGGWSGLSQRSPAHLFAYALVAVIVMMPLLDKMMWQIQTRKRALA